jgi:hypothetical protein
MLTNDRTTVVVQDELSLSNIHTVYWFAHYHNDIVNVELSADGRTALMRDDRGNTLRVSIVSDYSRFKFEIMDCYTFIHTSELDGTYPPSYAANSGAAEKDRSKYSKLAIKAEDVLSFKVAVVIEMNPDEDEVPYKWTPMERWAPGVYEYDDSDKVQGVQMRKTPKKSEVNSSAAKLNRYSGDGTAFGDKFNEFYRSLTDLKYALEYFGESALGNLYYTGIDALDIYGTEYDEYIGKINRNCDVGKGIAKSLVGF